MIIFAILTYPKRNRRNPRAQFEKRPHLESYQTKRGRIGTTTWGEHHGTGKRLLIETGLSEMAN